MVKFVSRAGLKLEHALAAWNLDVSGLICADLGSNVGGFVDCLLQRGAVKVYAIDTGYGVLDWKLRKDARVFVMERTNAMHVRLPELVDFVTIDVAWTKQKRILPAASQLLSETGEVVTLIKPHYEAPPALLRQGVLPEAELQGVVENALNDIVQAGFQVLAVEKSPVTGAKGNTEYLAHLRKIARR